MSLETTIEGVVPLVPDEIGRRRQLNDLLRLSELMPDREQSVAGPWGVVAGTGILFSAPHEVDHIRDGATKVAERGTGALAAALARATGGTALMTEPVQRGDPNWDLAHPYVTRARALAVDIPVVDLHMMRPRGVEMCLGLGPVPALSTSLWPAILDEAVAAGLRTSVNWPFGANPRTLTGQLQSRGHRALQVELSWHCFDSKHPAMPRAWSALLRAAHRLIAKDGSLTQGHP